MEDKAASELFFKKQSGRFSVQMQQAMRRSKRSRIHDVFKYSVVRLVLTTTDQSGQEATFRIKDATMKLYHLEMLTGLCAEQAKTPTNIFSRSECRETLLLLVNAWKEDTIHPDYIPFLNTCDKWTQVTRDCTFILTVDCASILDGVPYVKDIKEREEILSDDVIQKRKTKLLQIISSHDIDHKYAYVKKVCKLAPLYELALEMTINFTGGLTLEFEGISFHITYWRQRYLRGSVYIEHSSNPCWPTGSKLCTFDYILNFGENDVIERTHSPSNKCPDENVWKMHERLIVFLITSALGECTPRLVSMYKK